MRNFEYERDILLLKIADSARHKWHRLVKKDVKRLKMLYMEEYGINIELALEVITPLLEEYGVNEHDYNY